MKKFLLFLLVSISLHSMLQAQGITLPPSGENQKASVRQHIGGIVSVEVNYSSPNVHAPNGDNRTGRIWGTLVPFGLTDQGFGLREPAPWRAGANENTTIEFSHDVMVEGKPLAAGKYGLHLLVEQSGPWTWIFSKNNSAWGSYFYTAKEDALRVQVQPKDNSYTEWLTYTFTDRQPEEATLELQWENKAIPMRITVPNMTDVYVQQIDRELQNAPGFNDDNFAAAANYLLEQNENLDKALVWANQAINPPIGQQNFNNVTTKANVLLKMKRQDEALEAYHMAMNMSDATPFAVHALGRNLVTQGEKETAMKIFQMNYEKHKGAWPTNVGMTRGLAAVGKYDEAISYAKAALAEAPDDINKQSLTAMIERLKNRQDIN
jgi:tetratricopeptide (TPR) repeat protein